MMRGCRQKASTQGHLVVSTPRRFVIVYNAFHVAQHHAVFVRVHLAEVVGTAFGILIYQRLLVGVRHSGQQRVEVAVIEFGWHIACF